MFVLLKFNDNSGSNGEEPKPSVGFSLSANLLSAPQRTYLSFLWIGSQSGKWG